MNLSHSMILQCIIFFSAVLLNTACVYISYPPVHRDTGRFAGILSAAGTGFLIVFHSLLFYHLYHGTVPLNTGSLYNLFFFFFSVLCILRMIIISRYSKTMAAGLDLIHESLEKYHSIFANSNEAFLLFMVDDDVRDGTFIEANNAACSLLGYSADEIKTLSIDTVIIKSSFSSITEFKQVLLSSNHNTLQMQARTKSGLAIPVEISFHAYSMKQQNYILMIMRDITERILHEQKIHIALKEKEILLYEIHHRVKNNLQIISSLLDMVTMRIQDQSALSFLKDLESKIFTMSILHTHLYKHERFDSININECLRDIIQHIGRLYNTDRILIHIDCPNIFIPITIGIPVCLVINEALSNATLHAFDADEADRMCTIWICVSEKPNGELCVSVRDNGRGFPDSIDIDTTASIGIKLMRTITQDQLKGSFSIHNNNGTEVLLQFNSR